MPIWDYSSVNPVSRGVPDRYFFRRGAGVAELAALEMLCTGNCTVGSNPTLSAIQSDLSIGNLTVSVN
jgi:hypothetical protein